MRTNIKKIFCIVVTMVAMMTMCTTAVAETPEQRVERVYPSWKEDWEQWKNKGLVEEYDLEMKALVVGVVEHESVKYFYFTYNYNYHIRLILITFGNSFVSNNHRQVFLLYIDTHQNKK